MMSHGERSNSFAVRSDSLEMTATIFYGSLLEFFRISLASQQFCSFSSSHELDWVLLREAGCRKFDPEVTHAQQISIARIVHLTELRV
jgi:hypothetical protein